MNKKVLLINPSERHILENAGDRPPLPLLYIASYLRKQNNIVLVCDLNYVTFPQLLNVFNGFKPHYAGMSVYTSPIADLCYALASNLKNRFPEVKFVAGGYHVSVMKEDALKVFDYVVVGEGERFLEEIVNNPDRRIVYAEKVMNLDDIPLPARDLVDMSRYNLIQNGKRTTTLITSRGCPNNCVFCGNMNHRVRYHSPERVLEEILELRDKYGYESFYFLDDMFTFNKKRLYKVLDYLQPLDIKFRMVTRSDDINEDVAKKLSEAGCEIISFGLESGNDEILKRANKKTTVKQNEKAIEICYKYGIYTKGHFIIGLPGETEQTARDTIEFAKRMKKKGLKEANFYLLVPFPGTAIWRNPDKYGIEIVDRNFNNYLQAGKRLKAVIRTKDLDESDLERLVKEAKEEFQNA